MSLFHWFEAFKAPEMAYVEYRIDCVLVCHRLIHDFLEDQKKVHLILLSL